METDFYVWVGVVDLFGYYQKVLVYCAPFFTFRFHSGVLPSVIVTVLE